MFGSRVWLLSLVFLLGACGKKKNDSDDGDAGIPEGKSGTLTKELAGDFAEDESGGLTSVETFSTTTSDSSSSVEKLQTSSHSSTRRFRGLKNLNLADECEPEETGKNVDGDEDGFAKKYTAVYDCEETADNTITFTTGTIIVTDADDEDPESSGSYEFQDFQVRKELTEGDYDIKISFEADGYLKKTITSKSKSAELKYGVAYNISGLPDDDEDTNSLKDYFLPSLFYNLTTKVNVDDNTIELKGFVRQKGSRLNSKTKEFEPFDYALEIKTNEPLVPATTEDCSKGKFKAGEIELGAGTGTLVITYNTDCTRTVELDGEEI